MAPPAVRHGDVVVLSEALSLRQLGAALILEGMLVAELAPGREARAPGEGAAPREDARARSRTS
jgi:hypothetical protein